MSADLLTQAVRQARCGDCDGWGIAIGPFDPNLGRQEVVQCGRCSGNGISLRKVRIFLAKHNGHADLART
jgi:hypothetical protein